MLDIQLLRTDLEQVAARLASRGYVLDTAQFSALEAERKTLQTKMQDLQAQRNASSKLIGEAKRKGEDASAILAQVATQGDALKAAEQAFEAVQLRLDQWMLSIPNLPHGWGFSFITLPLNNQPHSL